MIDASRGPEGELRILDTDGRVFEDAVVPDIDDAELLDMYREMALARHLDERAISLARQGRLGTYTPLAGQEAAQIGSVHAIRDDDWLVPSFREHGGKMAHGLSPAAILSYWGGHEAGTGLPEDSTVFTEAIPVGTQIPHATGMGLAAKLKGRSDVVLCFLGDGATSEGDFHEGLNMAGVFDTPTVFFCNNNGWAISVPRSRQTASATIAQKATAYGFTGLLVDGMDPLASYAVTRWAAGKARDPEEGERRPTLIEALQYRFGPHTTTDDPSLYRDTAELEDWKRRDPLPRMERFLRDRGLLDDERAAAITAEVEALVADGVERFEAIEPDPDDLFEYTYSEPTPRLRDQRRWLARHRDRHGGDGIDE